MEIVSNSQFARRVKRESVYQAQAITITVTPPPHFIYLLLQLLSNSPSSLRGQSAMRQSKVHHYKDTIWEAASVYYEICALTA